MSTIAGEMLRSSCQRMFHAGMKIEGVSHLPVNEAMRIVSTRLFMRGLYEESEYWSVSADYLDIGYSTMLTSHTGLPPVRVAYEARLIPQVGDVWYLPRLGVTEIKEWPIRKESRWHKYPVLRWLLDPRPVDWYQCQVLQDAMKSPHAVFTSEVPLPAPVIEEFPMEGPDETD